MLSLFHTLGWASPYERISSLAYEDRKYPRHSNLGEGEPGPWSFTTRAGDAGRDMLDATRHSASLAMGKTRLW